VGQRIQVQPTVVDATAIFSTDRSITGQDGTSYLSLEDAAKDHRFPGQLATRMFESDPATDSVWIASNTIVVKRTGEWSEAASAAAAEVIEAFFLFY
jgi:hypothetical protein